MSKLALVFGNTWEVAALVISSILIMILMANMVAARCSGRILFVAYGGLGVSLITSFLIPTGALLAIPGGPRVIAAGTLVGLPIFFAGIVFAMTFRSCLHPNLALGSNLLGGIVGGACESFSFVIGLNALVLVALGFYLTSLGFQIARPDSGTTRQRTA